MKPTESEPVGTATVAAEEKLNPIESLNQLYTRNVKRLAEFQKKAVDLVAEQNAEIVGTWKKHSSGTPFVAEILDFQSAAFNRVVEAQKTAIDMVVEQSHAWAGFVRERTETATKVVEAGTKFARTSIEHAVEMQKTAIDFSTKQTAAALETAKKQFGDAGGPIGTVVDSMQRGVEAVAGAHKELLDISKQSTQILH